MGQTGLLLLAKDHNHHLQYLLSSKNKILEHKLSTHSFKCFRDYDVLRMWQLTKTGKKQSITKPCFNGNLTVDRIRVDIKKLLLFIRCINCVVVTWKSMFFQLELHIEIFMNKKM